MYDYIIVGCGFAGVVLAERLASAGKKILIIDKNKRIKKVKENVLQKKL